LRKAYSEGIYRVRDRRLADPTPNIALRPLPSPRPVLPCPENCLMLTISAGHESREFFDLRAAIANLFRINRLKRPDWRRRTPRRWCSMRRPWHGSRFGSPAHRPESADVSQLHRLQAQRLQTGFWQLRRLCFLAAPVCRRRSTTISTADRDEVVRDRRYRSRNYASRPA